MNRKLSLLLVVAMGLFLSACASKKKEQVIDTGRGQVENSNAYGTGYSKSALEALGIVGNPLNYKVIYFEYNSSAIDERSSIIASAHARHLATTSGTQMTLEGHADERGTRDFNLALGERRSQAVADLMRAVGVGNTNIRLVSYGEERPVETGHSEAAWMKNRRVEILY